jgi:hypothetical protein
MRFLAGFFPWAYSMRGLDFDTETISKLFSSSKLFNFFYNFQLQYSMYVAYRGY